MIGTDAVEVVRLAAAHFRFEAHRLAQARARFGLSPVMFYMAVSAAIDDPAVVAVVPVECGLLRRRRDAGQRQRRAG